jgi:CBS domain-containing protein
MTRDPVVVGAGAFAFEAAMLMAMHGIHHLCVVEDGKLIGVISERDLFSLQRVGLVNLTQDRRPRDPSPSSPISPATSASSSRR